MHTCALHVRSLSTGHMNIGTYTIRQLFKVGRATLAWSYLRVPSDRIRPITMSGSLLQDETAAYEVGENYSAVVEHRHGCKSSI